MDHIEKLLRKIPLKHRVQVLETVDCLHDAACRQTLRIEKISGSILCKVRSGKYRIGFDTRHNQVTIHFVRLRNEKTYRGI